jgi:hypothetical protein
LTTQGKSGIVSVKEIPLHAPRDEKRNRGQSCIPDRTQNELVKQKGEVSVGISDEAYFRKIFTETERYLSEKARAAGEGRAIDEANNFLRWFEFSGVLGLLEKHSYVSQDFLSLRKQADDLQEICKPFLQNRNVPLPPSLSRIDELNAKVDVLLAQSAKPVAPLLPEKRRSSFSQGAGGFQGEKASGFRASVCGGSCLGTTHTPKSIPFPSALSSI